MNEKANRWNRFIEEICYKDIKDLTTAQKNAVLCFWYDAEMNSGGHSGFFDCYPEIIPQELILAIMEVGNEIIADNFKKALTEGKHDSWLETDNAYYSFEPSLGDLLQEYVEINKDKIFEK